MFHDLSDYVPPGRKEPPIQQFVVGPTTRATYELNPTGSTVWALKFTTKELRPPMASWGWAQATYDTSGLWLPNRTPVMCNSGWHVLPWNCIKDDFDFMSVGAKRTWLVECRGSFDVNTTGTLKAAFTSIRFEAELFSTEVRALAKANVIEIHKMLELPYKARLMTITRRSGTRVVKR